VDVAIHAVHVDAVLHLPELRARIPLPAGPRIRLPPPLDLAGIEESLDDVIAAVRARAVDADDGRDAGEIGIDGGLLAGRRVEVDAEVDGAPRRHTIRERLLLRVLCVLDAFVVSVERVVRAPLPIRNDVDARGDERVRFGGAQVLARRVI